MLTPTAALDARSAAELERLGAQTVVILGSVDAISDQVEQELGDLGIATERINGPTRLETATAVAGRFLPQATSAILARADGDATDPSRAFADSLGAGALGAATGRPVLLSQSDRLSDATASYLRDSSITSVVVAGGAMALSGQVVADLEALGIVVERAAGQTRFETAALLAARAGHDAADRPLLVQGSGADAWASGFPASAQATASPLLLVDGDSVPQPTAEVLGAVGPSELVCGPSVSGAACAAASEILQPADRRRSGR